VFYLARIRLNLVPAQFEHISEKPLCKAVASYKSPGKKTSPLGEFDRRILHSDKVITFERTQQFFEIRIVRIQSKALQFTMAFFLEVPEELKRFIYPFFIHPPS
jgi:hypothetical protein